MSFSIKVSPAAMAVTLKDTMVQTAMDSASSTAKNFFIVCVLLVCVLRTPAAFPAGDPYNRPPGRSARQQKSAVYGK
ncbi:MAG: hypothetical protein HFF14_05350 [Angelakisella sp.]|nr:hypothetical protein [Angelakisella sp.]